MYLCLIFHDPHSRTVAPSHSRLQQGSLFDADGMMEDWWDDDTKQRFDEKVRCVVELYGRLRSEEVNATVSALDREQEKGDG